MTTLQDVENMNKENCTTIEGPLFIEDLGPEGSKNLSSLDTVEHVTQFLVVQRIRANYTWLHELLPRLRVIRGYRLYDNKWTLIMRDNTHLFIHDVQRTLLETASKNLNKRFVYFSFNLLQNDGTYNNSGNLTFQKPVSTNLCWESNYTDSNGSCHDSCPDGTVVVEGWRCAKSCGNVSIASFDCQEKKASVKTVPGILSYQSSLCLAPCKAPLSIVREVHELQYLQDCVVLEGNLRLSLTVSSMDMYLLEMYLGSLEELKGYLLVFRSWGMNSLQFFRNLTKLNTGSKLWNRRYALALYDNPDLERLWNRVNSLTVSSEGSVYLKGNPRLCSRDVEALNQSFSGQLDEDPGQYTSTACEPLKLSVRQNRLHWDDIQFNMTVVGQFMYQISIGNLSGQLSEKTVFQQWMADQGSPGDLKGWNVKEINSKTTNLPISKKDTDQDLIYHIRVVGLSEHTDRRSKVCMQSSNTSKNGQEKTNYAFVSRCQGLSSGQSLMIKEYRNCCLSVVNSNVTVGWNLSPDKFQVELEYKRVQGISWESTGPFNDIQFNKNKNCFIGCPPIFPNSSSNDISIPTEMTVGKSMPCSPPCSVCSNNTAKVLEDLEPYTKYALRIRKV